MANIRIKQAHQLGKDDARRRVDDIAEDLKQKLHVVYQWQGDKLVFKRTGAQGAIELGDDFVEVKVKLGMLVAPMKDKIEAQIKERLQTYLA
jgi:putative polyhydroxyalkanoate system protein